MNHVLCDGGLCNRLNALLFALMLQQRYGHAWQISWPRNNWCGAGFEELFSCPLLRDEQGIDHYKQHEARHLLLMHENQVGFDAASWVPNRTLASWEDYEAQLQRHDSVVYYNNLLPPFVTDDDVRQALTQLTLNPQVAETARRFIAERRIDARVLGLHIRKTDFGDRVDDEALFQQVRAAARPVFVCSDDAEVNARFAELPQCSVFPKTAFPQKLQEGAAWLHWTQDAQGRRFPFNIDRSDASVVEGLVDLLILSRTEIVPTSGSTFLATAQRFARCGYFAPESGAAVARTPAAPAPVTQADLERLLAHLQTRPLLSDTLVRLGPAGDGGNTLPLAALRARTVLAVGDAALPGGFAHWAASGVPPQQATSWPQPLPDGADLLSGDTGTSAWAALHGAGRERLAGYGVISVALHGLAELAERGFFDRAEALLSGLAHTHQLVHWRVRAAAGHFLLGGHPFPHVLETCWVARAGAQFGAVEATPVLQQLAQALQPPAATAKPKHGFSLFPTLKLLGLPAPIGVMQVGASYGQEMREFLEAGIRAGAFVEPLPEPYAHLAGVCGRIPNFVPVQALCSDAAGRRHDFHVASNGGMSSSLLKPANHLIVNDYVHFPTTLQLTSTTLDDVVEGLRRDGHGSVVDQLDLLYMDTQGAEFKILLGATRVLPQFKYLFFEVMRNDMYEGQTPFLTYCHLLEALGFTLNEVYFGHPQQTGNALFIRKDLVQVGA